MAQSNGPEVSEGVVPRRPADGPRSYRIASPAEPSKVELAGRSAAQGVFAAYQFADESRRDAGRQ